MVTSQRTEDSSGGTTAAGVPGTASSLPRPTSRPATGANRTVRTTENISYQSSRTVKKTHLPSGVVRKMSLAVLVDQEVSWEKDKSSFKRVLVPPSPEKLKVIRDLVAGITGYSQERGDQLVIETLPFETTLQLEPPAVATPAAPGRPGSPFPGLPVSLDRKTLLIAAGGATVLIVLGIAAAVFRRKRRKRTGTVEMASRPSLPAAAQAPAPGSSTELMSPAQLENQMESQLAERDALQAKMDAEALGSLKLAPVITKKAEVLAKHLREKIAKEPDVSVQILRTWIREEES
jgi:flagellar M-ring protein FliF